MLLPRRKDQDASQIIIIPAHLLLAEEADDLILSHGRVSIELCAGYAWRGIMRDEQIVEEGCDIVEYRFRVEEELGEETKILCVELVLLAVDFIE